MSISNLPLHAPSKIQEREFRLESLAALRPQLEEIAKDEFSGSVKVAIEEDAESPEYRYLVVSVETHADLPTIAASRRRWNERTLSLLQQDCDLVILTVTVQE